VTGEKSRAPIGLKKKERGAIPTPGQRGTDCEEGAREKQEEKSDDEQESLLKRGTTTASMASRGFLIGGK